MNEDLSGARLTPAMPDLDSPAKTDRGPLPVVVPRGLKRTGSRTDGGRTPAHLRVIGVALNQRDREYIRRKLGMRLGKFARSIERVTVRIIDENGPRGGVDLVCAVKVVLSGLPSIVVERRHARMLAAVDGALRGTVQAVQRTLARRRLRPRQRRALLTGAARMVTEL